MQRNRFGWRDGRSKRDGGARKGARGRPWLRAMVFGAGLASAVAFAAELAGSQVTLNFKNADIRSVVELVSKVTGKNFVLDPRVKGNVTVVSTAPVPPEVVYETFLSILAVHGYSAMPDGEDLVRIVPDNAAVASAGFSEHFDAADVLGGEMRISVIAVRHVDAGQLVPLLRPLVDKNGHLVAHPQSNALIVADSTRAIERLRRVIEVMDTVSDGDLSFFPLRYAVASKVATTLQPLIAGSAKGGAKSKVTLAADDRTNTLMVSGGEGPMIERLRLLIAHLDAPTDNAGDTRVVYLNYAKAGDLAEILRKLAEDMHKQSGEAKTAGGPAVGIQADTGTNSLLITAKPDDMRALLSAVEAMDIRRAQVLVETLIVELTDDKARKLGIQWVAAQDALFDLSDASALSASALDLGTLIGRLSAGAGINIGFLARALANDADANIISTPSLITMDNAEAEINVGREVPFVTGSYTSTGNSTNPSNPFTTIQRSNVGLTLKITPQINKGSVIRMDIDQEISSLLPGAAAAFGATDVVTSVRSLKTSVVVEDGEMLVLGGLVDDTLRENQVHFPLFGDLPLFGPLFSYRETTKEKRNLMIFIRPRILRDATSSQALSQRKYEHLREMQVEKKAEGVELLPDEVSPVLEPLTPPPASLPAEVAPAPVEKAPAVKALPDGRPRSAGNSLPDTFRPEPPPPILPPIPPAPPDVLSAPEEEPVTDHQRGSAGQASWDEFQPSPAPSVLPSVLGVSPGTAETAVSVEPVPAPSVAPPYGVVPGSGSKAAGRGAPAGNRAWDRFEPAPAPSVLPSVSSGSSGSNSPESKPGSRGKPGSVPAPLPFGVVSKSEGESASSRSVNNRDVSAGKRDWNNFEPVPAPLPSMFRVAPRLEGERVNNRSVDNRNRDVPVANPDWDNFEPVPVPLALPRASGGSSGFQTEAPNNRPVNNREAPAADPVWDRFTPEPAPSIFGGLPNSQGRSVKSWNSFLDEH